MFIIDFALWSTIPRSYYIVINRGIYFIPGYDVDRKAFETEDQMEEFVKDFIL